MAAEDRSTERWKPVVGWEDVYEVSNRGRVRSLHRDPWHPNRPTPHVLKLYTNHRGYQTVCLRSKGHKETIWVHKLVLEAFITPRSEGMECNHIDGNPSNNHLVNLEWVTHKENKDHSSRNGLDPRGIAVHGSKLNPQAVKVIRHIADSQPRVMSTLARIHGVSHKAIARVVNRETWRHVR